MVSTRSGKRPTSNKASRDPKRKQEAAQTLRPPPQKTAKSSSEKQVSFAGQQEESDSSTTPRPDFSPSAPRAPTTFGAYKAGLPLFLRRELLLDILQKGGFDKCTPSELRATKPHTYGKKDEALAKQVKNQFERWRETEQNNPKKWLQILSDFNALPFASAQATEDEPTPTVVGSAPAAVIAPVDNTTATTEHVVVETPTKKVRVSQNPPRKYQPKKKQTPVKTKPSPKMAPNTHPMQQVYNSGEYGKQ